MKYHIRKNWIESFELIVKRPIIIMPFVIISFFECLALEFVYFSTRSPISLLMKPVIRKFFGDAFIHYPGNLMMLPKLFYYMQVAIYIALGVFLSAISINIFKNIKEGLPVKINALTKNAVKNYISFSLYGVLIVVMIFLFRKADVFLFTKMMKLIARFMPQIPHGPFYLLLTLFLFVSNILLQVFFLLTVPAIVIEKRSLISAVWRSLSLSIRNFFTVLPLVFLPFLAYLPVTILKVFSTQLIDKTFPEITFYVTLFGIATSAIVDCFVFICISQFLLDIQKVEGKKLQ